MNAFVASEAIFLVGPLRVQQWLRNGKIPHDKLNQKDEHIICLKKEASQCGDRDKNTD